MKSFKDFIMEMDYANNDPESKNVEDRRQESPSGNRVRDFINKLSSAAAPPRRQMDHDNYNIKTREISKHYNRTLGGPSKFSEPNLQDN